MPERPNFGKTENKTIMNNMFQYVQMLYARMGAVDQALAEEAIRIVALEKVLLAKKIVTEEEMNEEIKNQTAKYEEANKAAMDRIIAEMKKTTSQIIVPEEKHVEVPGA